MTRIIFHTLAAGLVLALVAGCATVPAGRHVSDPSGRFSFDVGPDLAPKVEQEGFYQYALAKPGLDVFVAARPAALEEKGVEDIIRAAGLPADTLTLDGSTTFGEWQARRYRVHGRDLMLALAYQARGGTVYALLAAGSAAAMPADPPPSVMHVLGSIRFAPSAGNIAMPGSREELEDYVRGAAAARGGSISVAAVRDGHIVYRYATGAAGLGTQATPATAYHWGSMTKLVTATAVMKLVEAGAVQLDAPVARYIPSFPKDYRVTVRNLLGHTSGLPERDVRHLVAYGSESLPALDDLLAGYLAGLHSLDFAPGSDAAYSNWNYLVLGVLVERVTGMPYESYVAQAVLRPLGMEHTVFRLAAMPVGTAVASPIITAAVEPDLIAHMNANRPLHDGESLVAARSGGLSYLADFDIVAPWGGLVGPADDLARFLAMQLGSPPALLSPGTLAAMRRSQRGWGLGWTVQKAGGETVAEHAGGAPGIDCLMRIYPDRHLGIVVLGNVNDYGASRILSAAADIISKEAR